MGAAHVVLEIGGLFGTPCDLLGVEDGRLDGEFLGIPTSERLRDATSCDRVRAGIVRIHQGHTVFDGRHFECALALAITVDSLVEHERVDDRRRVGERGQAVAQSLRAEQGQVVGSVIDRDGEAAPDQGVQDIENLADDLGRRAPLGTRSRKARGSSM